MTHSSNNYKEYEKILDEHIKSLPPVEEGYVRVFEDHTYRWYTDYTQEEYDAMINDPLAVILREEVQKEIDKEIIELINKKAKEL